MASLRRASDARVVAGRSAIEPMAFEATGHNLMRYRPAEVTGAILSLAAPAASPV